jgi:hypothetical protein
VAGRKRGGREWGDKNNQNHSRERLWFLCRDVENASRSVSRDSQRLGTRKTSAQVSDSACFLSRRSGPRFHGAHPEAKLPSEKVNFFAFAGPLPLLRKECHQLLGPSGTLDSWLSFAQFAGTRATARHQPALAPAIFTGRHET